MNKITTTAILVVLAAAISIFIYFISGVSSTFPPIEKYKYSGNIDSLIRQLRKYTTNNPTVTLQITDTTGIAYGKYAIYMTIEIKTSKESLEYDLKCKKSDNKNSTSTNISLVGAIDNVRHLGGYQINAKGVDTLLKYFDNHFLVDLKNKQNAGLLSQ